MKIIHVICLVFFIGLFLFGCKKEVTKVVPTAITTAVTNITTNSATTGGEITSDGGAEITVRGVCWNTSVNPTIENSCAPDYGGLGSFVCNLLGLKPGTIYYIRSYATNSIGTAYGNEISFTTLATVPILTTSAASQITNTTATSGGNVTSDGGSIVTARGVCWSTSITPTIIDSKSEDGSGIGVFTSSITGLTPGTTYFFRAYATNSMGTSYGEQLSLATLGPPTIKTTSITEIKQTTATSGGDVTYDGGATVTDRGVCWSTTQNPTIADNHSSDGAGKGVFTSNLTNLLANTKYYVRAFASNFSGTAYGNEIFFATNGEPGTVSDIDGNTYLTILIGTQTWMAENLKTTKYSDGTNIPLVNTEDTWNALTLTNKAYCWYNDNIINKDTYGALYTWAASMNEAISSNTKPSGVQGVCPVGWHLPSDAEWVELETYLGGNSIAGGKMKETGTAHWLSPNDGATNESGFLGLPGGSRNYYGLFNDIGNTGYWWSSTESSTTLSYFRSLDLSNTYVLRSYYNKEVGFSVRCVKD